MIEKPVGNVSIAISPWFKNLGLAALLLFCVPVVLASPIPSAPTLKTTSHVLFDFASGRALVEQDADNQVEPASLTKIMTTFLVFEELAAGRISEDDLVTISKRAWQTEGSRMFVEVGKQIPVIDLLVGMVVQSGNDASVALAEHIAGSEDAFAELMNATARQLDMVNSQFKNATGLPAEGHFSSARDMALLAAETLRRFPQRYQLYAQKEFTFNGIRQHNRNRLLWRDSSVDGLKTGHTEAAGYCLVASAERDGMRLISVVTGTTSDTKRFEETQSLLNYGFRFFEVVTLFKGGEVRSQAPVYAGAVDSVPVGIADDLVLTLPRGRMQDLSAVVEIDREIPAPVVAGTELGELLVSLDGELLARQPLLALEGVPEGSLFQQAEAWVRSFFE
ncbi:MAG: serine-type D-Ala-D-Ala carboxypeptidase [Gammaproteobacteria bacterium]|nr:MAG: serine-type D-Ala-D-Ala carboxypeptidase [Gammaproteobacteria bacterium]